MPNRKSELYNHLKAQGWVPTKHYREYSAGELEDMLRQGQTTLEPQPMVTQPARAEHVPPQGPPGDEPPPAEFFGYEQPVPVQNDPDPEELPGQRKNTKDDEDVIRVDEQGRRWLQEEVRKPAYPKPRGRRVLTYTETGVETQTVKNGEYVETFEVAGKRPAKASEVKITLPSFQVGIYRDPRYPFKVHCYNSREGFDFFEVNEYYGGAEMVPPIVKRVYIENSLCYDIRSVIRAINEEFRALQLQGKIK